MLNLTIREPLCLYASISNASGVTMTSESEICVINGGKDVSETFVRGSVKFHFQWLERNFFNDIYICKIK